MLLLLLFIVLTLALSPFSRQRTKDLPADLLLQCVTFTLVKYFSFTAYRLARRVQRICVVLMRCMGSVGLREIEGRRRKFQSFVDSMLSGKLPDRSWRVSLMHGCHSIDLDYRSLSALRQTQPPRQLRDATPAF